MKYLFLMVAVLAGCGEGKPKDDPKPGEPRPIRKKHEVGVDMPKPEDGKR